jgi:GMP synthase (glutamine-hydrolysing)
MKTAVAIRHLAFEDLGLIEPWLRCRGWRIVTYDAGVDELCKIDMAQLDLLVVLGGPIGAHDDALYPFLAEEVDLIRQRLDSGRPILGICLGAQLIARALGASVTPMRGKEIGYAPLQLSAAGQASPLAALAGQPVLHWHGDQFDLPAGMPSLAATPICPHQAFMAGDHAMAWQFHLEVDAGRIEQWLIGHTGELRQAGIDIAALRQAAAQHRAGLAAGLDAVLADWFGRLRL